MGQLVVTVDGPAGTGKSTVSRLVASRLGIPHLDTGAYYRAATLVAIRSGVSPSDEDGVLRAVDGVEMDQRGGVMYVDGEDVSVEIRDPMISSVVSIVAAHTRVRAAMVARQREWVDRHGGSAVVEGRDIGSVVFPNAQVKIYLDASPEVRAKRRSQDTGQSAEQVLDEQSTRDRIDSTREASPLQVPDGAHVIDTTSCSVEEVVDSVLSLAGSSRL